MGQARDSGLWVMAIICSVQDLKKDALQMLREKGETNVTADIYLAIVLNLLRNLNADRAAHSRWHCGQLVCVERERMREGVR